ncbi:MAG TPA: DUF934 domain-containing protein [Caulobacteraceae bacterium]|nr:DUF934 domain-containing protein [Caulobacteraceae bacterium]
MPKLIRIEDGHALEADDSFVFIGDDEAAPASGDLVVSLARFQSEGDGLMAAGHRLGVRLLPHEEAEALAYDLPRLAVVELKFDKFRDGRPYSNAILLRERFGFAGELRAVGDVLREQAQFMLRCGFDAFAPADGSGADEWLAATRRYRHVYQAAADHRAPIYAERAQEAAASAKEEVSHGL